MIDWLVGWFVLITRYCQSTTSAVVLHCVQYNSSPKCQNQPFHFSYGSIVLVGRQQSLGQMYAFQQYRSPFGFPFDTEEDLWWISLDFRCWFCFYKGEIISQCLKSNSKKTYSTLTDGKVTVFQKSLPYSQVRRKCSSNSSSINALYWIDSVFHINWSRL